jgi:hypothetical protein
MLAIGFARQPGLSRQYFAARPDQCNFSDQLPDEQVAKRIEVLRDQDKSAPGDASAAAIRSVGATAPTSRHSIHRSQTQESSDEEIDRLRRQVSIFA